MRGRHTLAAAAGVLCLLVAGCGGNPEPKPPPKAEPSTSPSASATPPAMPAAAKEKTRAGAESAVRHFMTALNYSGTTGDTDALRGAFDAQCTRCEALAKSIDKTYDAGGYYKGGDWIPRKVKFYKITGDVAILDALVDYEAQTWVKSDGAKPVTYKASTDHLHAFQMQWDGARWRVGALDPQL